MQEVLAVGIGGMLGAWLRYGVNLWVRSAPNKWPYATLLVNFSGAFVAGLLLSQIHKLDPMWRAGVVTGFLGALTTFSAFSTEALNLWIQRRHVEAFLYVTVMLFGGLMCCALGWGLGRVWQ